jgi:hypothetical protein
MGFEPGPAVSEADAMSTKLTHLNSRPSLTSCHCHTSFPGWNIFLTFTYFTQIHTITLEYFLVTSHKYLHTITMRIELQRIALHFILKVLKTLHPGEIRTNDLLFRRWRRLPLHHAARASPLEYGLGATYNFYFLNYKLLC